MTKEFRRIFARLRSFCFFRRRQISGWELARSWLYGLDPSVCRPLLAERHGAIQTHKVDYG